METIKTNDRFDRLTNLDISTHYRGLEYYLMEGDFFGAFSYWVVKQSPYNEIDPVVLKAFKNYISNSVFKGSEGMPKKFTYDELTKVVNEKVFESIPEIEKLNHAKIEQPGFIASSSRYHDTKPEYSYIDLGALARNIFYMLLREVITQ